MLLEALKVFKSELEQIDSWFEPASRKSSRDYERWGPIDFIAHSAAYIDRRVKILSDPEAVKTIDNGDELDDMNRSIFEAHLDSAWEDVVGMLKSGLASLREVAIEKSEAELSAPDPLSPERPVWRGVAFYGIVHTLSHLGLALVREGNNDKAVSLQRQMTQNLKAISDSKPWTALIEYNHARILALTQDPEALEHLNRAIAIDPAFAKRAEHDPDFISIRDRIEF